eukprot:7378680-Prymnesium_polylepis.1
MHMATAVTLPFSGSLVSRCRRVHWRVHANKCHAAMAAAARPKSKPAHCENNATNRVPRAVQSVTPIKKTGLVLLQAYFPMKPTW